MLVGRDEFEEMVEVVVEDIGVDQFLALTVHEADVHLAGVEIDSAIVFGRGGVILHMCNTWWCRKAPVDDSNVNAGSARYIPRPISLT